MGSRLKKDGRPVGGYGLNRFNELMIDANPIQQVGIVGWTDEARAANLASHVGAGMWYYIHAEQRVQVRGPFSHFKPLAAFGLKLAVVQETGSILTSARVRPTSARATWEADAGRAPWLDEIMEPFPVNCRIARQLAAFIRVHHQR